MRLVMALVAIDGAVGAAIHWLNYVKPCSLNSIGASDAVDVNGKVANDDDQGLVLISVWFPIRLCHSPDSCRRPYCDGGAINFRQAFHCRSGSSLMLDRHVFSFACAVWRVGFGTKFSLGARTTGAIGPVRIFDESLCIATCDILFPIPSADYPYRQRDIYPLCVFCLQTEKWKKWLTNQLVRNAPGKCNKFMHLHIFNIYIYISEKMDA